MSSTGDSTVVFSKLQDFVSESSFTLSLDRLQESIAKGTADGTLSVLTQLQYEIQLGWVQKGHVPHMENIMFSRGLLGLEPGKSYCVNLSGIQVSIMDLRVLNALINIVFTSIRSAEDLWLVDSYYDRNFILIALQHIGSADPGASPLIDPRFLSHPFVLSFLHSTQGLASNVMDTDLESLIAGYRSIEKTLRTEPFKACIEKQSIPPVVLTKDEDVAGQV